MFLLLIFKDSTLKSKPLKILKFQQMKHLIQFSGGEINYYDVRREHMPKYKTRKSQYRVIKI